MNDGVRVTIRAADGREASMDTDEAREIVRGVVESAVAKEWVDRGTGEIHEGQGELPGMPERPAPLWEADGLLSGGPVRSIVLSLSGGVDLASSVPGDRVLAEALLPGESVYLQVEGVVTKRGVASKQGTVIGQAGVNVLQVVRADEAGVLDLQATLEGQTRAYRELADAADEVLARVRDRLPVVPGSTDDSPRAKADRELLAACDVLRMRASAAHV